MQPDIVRVFRLQWKTLLIIFYCFFFTFLIFFLQFLCRRFLRNCLTDFLQILGSMHYHLNFVPMFNFLKIHFRSLFPFYCFWMTFLSEYLLKNDSNQKVKIPRPDRRHLNRALGFQKFLLWMLRGIKIEVTPLQCSTLFCCEDFSEITETIMIYGGFSSNL